MAIMMVAMLSVGFASCGDDDDSSSNDSDEVECGMCHGSGQCFSCKGAGKIDCRCIEFSNNGKCWQCKGTGRLYNYSTRDYDVTCPSCNGSGLCEWCYGTLKETCSFCDGSGICEKCGGIGKLTANGDRLPGYGDNGNGGNSGGGGDDSRKCQKCGGTGKCSNHRSSDNLKLYCQGSGICKPCGGTGQLRNFGLYHRCTYCNKKINDDLGNGECGFCGGSGNCTSCGGKGFK